MYHVFWRVDVGCIRAWQLPAPASRSSPSLKQDDSLGIHSIFQLGGISIQALGVNVTHRTTAPWWKVKKLGKVGVGSSWCVWECSPKTTWSELNKSRISHFPTGILTPQQAKSCPLPWLWSLGQYNHNSIPQPCILLPLAQPQVLGIGSLFWQHSHVAWKKSFRFSKCCLSPSGPGYCSLGDCGCSFHSFPPQRGLCRKQKATVRLLGFVRSQLTII